PGGGPSVRAARHFHAGRARAVGRRLAEVGGRRVPADLRQAQARMTASLPSGGPDAASARAAAVSLAVRPRSRGWFQSQSSRPLAFGYLLLAPPGPYVLPPGRLPLL